MHIASEDTWEKWDQNVSDIPPYYEQGQPYVAPPMTDEQEEQYRRILDEDKGLPFDNSVVGAAASALGMDTWNPAHGYNFSDRKYIADAWDCAADHNNALDAALTTDPSDTVSLAWDDALRFNDFNDHWRYWMPYYDEELGITEMCAGDEAMDMARCIRKEIKILARKEQGLC